MADGDEHARRAVARGGLSLDRIVTETLALIDEQGIAMASMRSVGERLGVRAMSLYRYVASREELFDAVVERIVDELGDDPEVRERADEGWQDYLMRLARGVRRYARAHPHAFPLVATRPPDAPWINPPLRSLRWIEGVLNTLSDEKFTDEQVLFTYRSFNSFLLGYLLLETSAMALSDPKPGDGSFQQGSDADGTDPVDPGDPVPGSLSPARTAQHREALDDADHPADKVDPVGAVDPELYPLIHRLSVSLTEDHYDEEFEAGLAVLFERVAAFLSRRE